MAVTALKEMFIQMVVAVLVRVVAVLVMLVAEKIVKQLWY